MEFEDKIGLECCRKEYCEYGPATGIFCWVYDVLGELYPTRLSGLMGRKQIRVQAIRDPFPGEEATHTHFNRHQIKTTEKISPPICTSQN